MDFAKSVSFKSYGEKNYFFAALARSALRRVRVQSDLLDETAIEASVVVACTKGSFHKKRCTYFAPSLYFLGKLTLPRPIVGRFTVRTPRNSDRTLAMRTRTHVHAHVRPHPLTADTLNQSNRNRTPALKFICTGSTDSGRNHCNVGVGRKANTWGICGRCVRALSLYWTHFVCESPVVFVCGISSFVHLDISTL